ncbi:hypothetical protein PMAYCL1PPCAC_13976, partial [Pristionchus mayeri]
TVIRKEESTTQRFRDGKAGYYLRCDCGHESYNSGHNQKCEISNFTVICDEEQVIRRLVDNMVNEVVRSTYSSNAGEVTEYGDIAKYTEKKKPPKKPMLAFRIWLKKNRVLLKMNETLNGLTGDDYLKAVAVEYGTMEDKGKWLKAAAKDRERYEREMMEFDPSFVPTIPPRVVSSPPPESVPSLPTKVTLLLLVKVVPTLPPRAVHSPIPPPD